MSLPRILLIDDDSEVIDRLQQVAEGEMDLVGSASVDEVFRLLQESTWDLVLLDVNLLLVRGDRLITRIRERLGEKTPPVVYFSALDEDELRELVNATGAAGFLIKGVRNAELLDGIRAYLS